MSVAVLGGGVAGVTAAHELAARGFDVTLYEARALGGKARSIFVPGTARAEGQRALPGEHGFRFVASFYKHLPDTLARIPFGQSRRGVLDNLVPTEKTRLVTAREGGSFDILAALPKKPEEAGGLPPLPDRGRRRREGPRPQGAPPRRPVAAGGAPDAELLRRQRLARVAPRVRGAPRRQHRRDVRPRARRPGRGDAPPRRQRAGRLRAAPPLRDRALPREPARSLRRPDGAAGEDVTAGEWLRARLRALGLFQEAD